MYRQHDEASFDLRVAVVAQQNALLRLFAKGRDCQRSPALGEPGDLGGTVKVVKRETANVAVVPADQTPSAGLLDQDLLHTLPTPYDGGGPAALASRATVRAQHKLGLAMNRTDADSRPQPTATRELLNKLRLSVTCFSFVVHDERLFALAPDGTQASDWPLQPRDDRPDRPDHFLVFG